MSGKIEKRRSWTGSGMMNTPDKLEELDERRAYHERITRGKPQKPFSQVLHEKMHPDEQKPEPDEQPPEKGAIDPHMGLSPGQSPDLARSGKGRRAGRVIVKG